MAMSQYLSQAVLKHITNKATLTSPALYAALCTVLPLATDTGSTLTELNYTSYARVLINTSDLDVIAIDGTGKAFTTNVNAIAFPTSTGGPSPTAVAIAICDASTAGHLLYFNTLTQQQQIFNGSPVVVPVGALDFTQV